MAEYTNAWLSYKMKALTNEKIWSKVTIVCGDAEEERVCFTAAKELIRAAKELFGVTMESERLADGTENRDVTRETERFLSDGRGVLLLCNPALKSAQKDGYRLESGKDSAVITAGTGNGILYGAFDLIRTERLWDNVCNLKKECIPSAPLRMLNHWDNCDGSIERGYSGNSFFFENNELTVNDRTGEYARLCASVGLNATVINNVNVRKEATQLITPRYLNRVRELSEVFADYGIRLFLSLNFAAPIELGGLPVSDPCDSRVIAWWKETMEQVYRYVPKLGGFLVKADSEGRPGPHTYGRTQAEGANMLAEALRPYGGSIIWRCFVYNCTQDWRDKKTDRARAGYDYFKPLDGQFADNVVLQIKNGPMDFQVREPVSPLFGGLLHTNQMLEVQAAQEYTGQQKHLCYLIPMWKEVLAFRTYCKEEKDTVRDLICGNTFPQTLCGITAVANTGNDKNWTGHDFAALNWYGFGRLAFDMSLSAEEIAREWLMLTISRKPEVTEPLLKMVMSSWDTYEKYTSPLGIGWMVNPNHHYGPNAEGYEYDRWGTYHRADRNGIGVDRTPEGTGYTQQYNEPNRSMYESVEKCPEELLLFFHRISYDYVLKTGKTLVQHIYDTHFEGADTAAEYLATFESLKEEIPADIYEESHKRFEIQAEHAKEWRDRINTYFFRLSGVPDEKGRTIY